MTNQSMWPPLPTVGNRLAKSVRTAGNVVSALTIIGGGLAVLLGVLHKGEPGAMQIVAAGIAGVLWGWWIGAISRGVAHVLERQP